MSLSLRGVWLPGRWMRCYGMQPPLTVAAHKGISASALRAASQRRFAHDRGIGVAPTILLRVDMIISHYRFFTTWRNILNIKIATITSKIITISVSPPVAENCRL